jgi:hypothetical protein
MGAYSGGQQAASLYLLIRTAKLNGFEQPSIYGAVLAKIAEQMGST